MADDLHDGEFWLPSHFLTDEDILIDFDASTTLSSSGFNSDLGSPVDSVTETESDDDDYLPDLTLQLSRSSLLPSKASEVRQPGIVVSPLPITPSKKGTGYFDSTRGLAKQSTAPKTPNFIAPQYPAAWSQQIKKQQRLPPPLMSTSAWPTIQRAGNRQQTRAATATQMRAVFLGPPGGKRESVGTGVFLPRNVNPTEPRMKSNKHGCATVLMPEKVVEALTNMSSKSQSQSKIDSLRSVEIQLPSEWTY